MVNLKDEFTMNLNVFSELYSIEAIHKRFESLVVMNTELYIRQVTTLNYYIQILERLENDAFERIKELPTTEGNK